LAIGHPRNGKKGTRLVEQRRADEVTTLLSSALARDMRGVQQSILVPFQREQLVQPYEISNIVVRAFAQFPYPESFFVWTRMTNQNAAGSALLFNRTDRPPKWEDAETVAGPFPVTTIRDSPIAYRLSSLARGHVLPRYPLGLLCLTCNKKAKSLCP
jgi:hypothetical protein